MLCGKESLFFCCSIQSGISTNFFQEEVMSLPSEIAEQIGEALPHIGQHIGQHVAQHVAKEQDEILHKAGNFIDSLGNQDGELDMDDVTDIAGGILEGAGHLIAGVFSLFT
jgi:hypothetical protein